MSDLLVCRACLRCKVPVYNILRTKYQEAFERMAAISMADSKPHALCAPCLETLDKCCRLQEKCAISEGILNRLLQENQLTEDTIAAVDRQQHNLVDTLPTFTLEHMRPSEVEKSEDIKNKLGSNTEPWEPQKLEGPTHNATLRIKSGKRQSSENPTDEAVLRIEPDKTQSLEDLRHVVVKTEPEQSPENHSNNLMPWIEPGEIQCPEEPGIYQMIKTEPGVTQSSEVTSDVEPATSHSVKEQLNQSSHSISIETVKLKEMPYIQIDAGKLLKNVKSEDDKSSVEIEVNQPITHEFDETSNAKNNMRGILASNSSKGVKDVKVQHFIEKCNVDGRRIKKVSSVQYEGNKPKTQAQLKPYHCNKCYYQTPYKKRLMYHMKKHSGFVICAVCDYQCATKSRLVSHLRVHTKERPYICKECNKGFTELCSLTKHMNMHKGVKPYKCLWCDYEAASKNHLDRHIKRHIGDKRFKCELCDYACVQKWDLKRHARTHENERARSYKRVAPVIVKTVSIAKE
ncbi:histone-lysine N-methyltransferase PRDM9-like [Cydia pomonella]|uniref:histone-lysine N-methyltransferase PRDM9-like n=1 Tax=Cydia pomonella TaxID=82600 RepID=UPI002ADD4F7A|nr:histone-lysine N-methyltransferase PRDM9-like [Cydia pomonella]